MRIFPTGATRDDDDTKPHYARFLSPLVIRRFGEYMVKHRVQADGKLRDPDNWKKGMPTQSYLDSSFRHYLARWLDHDGFASGEDIEDSLCGELFNTMAHLHEILKVRYTQPVAPHDTMPPADRRKVLARLRARVRRRLRPRAHRSAR